MKYLDEYKAHLAKTGHKLGRLMQLNLEMVENGLREGRFFFDEKKANLKIKFIETFCHHVKGQTDLIVLEPWQKYVVACIFGLVNSKGKRQFKEIILITGRKQGKSLFASALQVAVLFTEMEPGMEIYNLAPKLLQAKIIFGVAKEQISKIPDLASRVKNRRDDIWYPATSSQMMPVAFTSKKSDGFNPYWVTYDEFAAWPGQQSLDMYNVMLSGSGARRNQPPVHFSCSTANFMDDGLYDYLMERAQDLLEGRSAETTLLPFIYMIDDVQKWDDIDELYKAMPNLGVSIDEDTMREEIAKAYTDRAYKPEFLTKYCNIKQNVASAWLSSSDIKKTQCECLNLEDFRGCYAVGGVDLSKTTDLTAASIVIQKDGIDYCFTQFFMCSKAFKELTNYEKINYPKFHDLGYLTIAGDETVDYEYVSEWFESLTEKYEISIPVIGYDRWSATYFVNDMKERGFKMDDVIQGTNLTPVINEFGDRIFSGTVKTGTNGLLQSHMKDVVLKQVANDNRFRPEKINKRRHIDGFVSVIDAITVRAKWWYKYGPFLTND